MRDSLAEWSKALDLGSSPKGRGFKSHSCHFRGFMQIFPKSAMIIIFSLFVIPNSLLAVKNVTEMRQMDGGVCLLSVRQSVRLFAYGARGGRG